MSLDTMLATLGSAPVAHLLGAWVAGLGLLAFVVIRRRDA